jgi:hypothetical protein
MLMEILAASGEPLRHQRLEPPLDRRERLRRLQRDVEKSVVHGLHRDADPRAAPPG